jgi:hypothetical protein
MRLFLIFAALTASAMDLKVHLYNQARVSPADIETAKKEAGLLFEKAGIMVHWKDCVASCGPENHDDALVVWINNSSEAISSDTALGFAAPFAGRGNQAVVLYPRICQFAPEPNRPFLLGAVIAHELAHLLFRSNQHSQGIMRASWRRDDLPAMSQRRFRFTPDQANQLRSGLLKRAME